MLGRRTMFSVLNRDLAEGNFRQLGRAGPELDPRGPLTTSIAHDCCQQSAEFAIQGHSLACRAKEGIEAGDACA